MFRFGFGSLWCFGFLIETSMLVLIYARILVEFANLGTFVCVRFSGICGLAVFGIVSNCSGAALDDFGFLRFCSFGILVVWGKFAMFGLV